MSSLVTFDQQGAFGPAVNLIYNAPYLNSTGITKLLELVKTNFELLANRTTSWDREFYNTVVERNLLQCPMSSTEILATKFFQSMQNEDNDFVCRRVIMEQIVPHMLKSAKAHLPELDDEDLDLKRWTGRFVECLMTEEQIQKHCEVQGEHAKRFMDERAKVGTDLMNTVQKQEFSENDLDIMIALNRVALQSINSADHYHHVLNFSGRYLTLFGMIADKPQSAGDEILDLLSVNFRKKMFKKQKEEPVEAK